MVSVVVNLVYIYSLNLSPLLFFSVLGGNNLCVILLLKKIVCDIVSSGAFLVDVSIYVRNDGIASLKDPANCCQRCIIVYLLDLFIFVLFYANLKID